MRIKKLRLENVRAMESAELRFRPGFNLVAGVNGVGKTTVLDALRICASRILPSISDSRARSKSFEVADIRSKLPYLEAELTFAIGDTEFRFKRREWRQEHVEDDPQNVETLRREILDSDRLQDRPRKLLRELAKPLSVSKPDVFEPSKAELVDAARANTTASQCIFFASNRSTVSGSKTKSRASGGKSAAYAESLDPRPLYVRQFAEWMRAREVLGAEDPVAKRQLRILQSALCIFLPDYDKLRPSNNGSGSLTINRSGTSLEIAQLSDGERGVLALVLDIARRLTQANPGLDDPLGEGRAVVLIDEIELHLHPGWQRQIVKKLVKTFPNCQFIATTHSPQVIGEVKRDCIQIIAGGAVYPPIHSFGVDSSRVLEEIMGTDSRTKCVMILLSKISTAIRHDRYDEADKLLAKLSRQLGEDDPEITRIQTLVSLITDNG